jgi:hypothetical protein
LNRQSIITRLDLPPKIVAFHRIATIPGDFQLPPILSQIRVTQRFVTVHSNRVNRPSLRIWRIDTQQPYELSTPREQNSLTVQHLVFSGQYLTVYATRTDAKQVFQLVYPLPDTPHSSSSPGPSEPILLVSSSQQKLTYTFNEPIPCHCNIPVFEDSECLDSKHESAVLAFSPSGLAVRLCLLELFSCQDGSMRLQKIEISPDTDAFWLNASSNKTSARACSLSGRMGTNLSLFSLRQDGPDLVISTQTVQNPFSSPSDVINAIAFDGFRGRICILYSEHVEILDFV